jgi:hypothetical protein
MPGSIVDLITAIFLSPTSDNPSATMEASNPFCVVGVGTDKHDVAVAYLILVRAILLFERITHDFKAALLKIVGIAAPT